MVQRQPASNSRASARRSCSTMLRSGRHTYALGYGRQETRHVLFLLQEPGVGCHLGVKCLVCSKKYPERRVFSPVYLSTISFPSFWTRFGVGNSPFVRSALREKLYTLTKFIPPLAGKRSVTPRQDVHEDKGEQRNASRWSFIHGHALSIPSLIAHIASKTRLTYS